LHRFGKELFTMRSWSFLSLLLILSVLLAACGPVAPAGLGATGPQPVAEATAAPAAGHDAGHDAHMDHSMAMDATQPFDAQFIDSMIEHHQGAVTMAQAALAESERAEIIALANAIIAAQEGEIAQMLAWRAAWHPDLPATAGMGMAMGDMNVADDDSQPFDQRFLTAMISHHQGAIDMARMAQEMSDRPEIDDLAAAIIVAQEGEIAQMQGWLAEWFE
jgi:uncharacterized protein (DUF305 family)